MTDTELIVDLRGQLIETLNDFWGAVSEPCGLPEWFGRNLDAW
ncbi:barstar family protein, partial [Streptomyces niveus]